MEFYIGTTESGEFIINDSPDFSFYDKKVIVRDGGTAKDNLLVKQIYHCITPCVVVPEDQGLPFQITNAKRLKHEKKKAK